MKHLFYLIFLFFSFALVSAQQTDYVDFKSANGLLGVRFESSEIGGQVWYEFEVLKSVDSIFINAVNMKIDAVTIREVDGSITELDYNNDGKKLWLNYDFKEGLAYKVHFNYKAKPKRALYFVERESEAQVWSQGQGQGTSHWFPSIDDVNDKLVFNLSVTLPKEYTFITNGKETASIPLPDNYVKWHYNMQKPMSSYLFALAIGKYDKTTEMSKSGIPLEYYYYPEDSLKAEPTYRHTKQLFDFLEEEIGFPYPWQNYKQVPVKDFLYSGMENTSLTIFSDGFVTDSIAFIDKNYITVNAHELAHQWFGDLVTATSGEHHWLQEGFATYYAMLAERAIFGDNHYYWQLFKNAQELIAQEAEGQSTSLLDLKSSSVTFYKKGAWALHILREKVGDSAFKSAVTAYLEKYQFDTVKTSDFISEIEIASGQDVSNFVKEWLVETSFPEDAVVKSLKQSQFMQECFSINCEVFEAKCLDYLVSDVSDAAKIKVISQVADKIDAGAFQNGIKVRQAIAKYVDKIPTELKFQYESLLEDASYVTIENALYHLWVNFPLDRVKYLQKTKDIRGFNDYNVRLLWLALHLNTVEYQSEKKEEVLDELIRYSLADRHFELRMNAFAYLKLLDAFDEASIKSLLEAVSHHNWRFSKYAKELISELEQVESYKQIINKFKQ
ncbi:M1 family metallopeptidase [Psychroserpens algicola]|uniref:Aminopeptidase N n=1 Tax=Psychroserpens algicola TaxID=1719034 RepID=A0ABT0H5R6_9FLAO|nr:M1 family metallopeptidase [Psychroserpens algicola]MCK8479716.1 M1 family metallopeptidase [Psychroserpens algicola]